MKKNGPPGRSARVFRKIRLYVIIYLFLLALGLNSYAIQRRALLKNAGQLGDSLAASYAAEERNNLTVYETLLSFGTLNLDRLMEEENWTQERKESWLQQYFRRVLAVVGQDRVDPYAAVNGRIVAANPWEGDTDYDY